MSQPPSDHELKQLFTSYMGKELFLSKNGEWFHEGVKFSHKKLASLFHRSIRWDAELNSFVIRIGKGRATFTHDGYVRFVTAITETDAGISVIFASDESLPMSPKDLCIQQEEDQEIFLLRSPGFPTARFTRRAQQLLLQYAQSDNSLKIGDAIFTIPSCGES